MYNQEMATKAAEDLRLVRERKPLVHNITNYVVMNYTANALLACGAAPEKPGARTKGVDSVHTVDQVAEMAVALAGKLRLTVAVTGVVDLITNGDRACRVMNGHEMMGHVTGTGCTATAIIGAFLAVEPDSMIATATGLSYFGLAGEKAAEKTSSPGTYQIALLNALYEMNEEELRWGARIQA
jgi:hydroxyethylthiazole kinase